MNKVYIHIVYNVQFVYSIPTSKTRFCLPIVGFYLGKASVQDFSIPCLQSLTKYTI